MYARRRPQMRKQISPFGAACAQTISTPPPLWANWLAPLCATGAMTLSARGNWNPSRPSNQLHELPSRVAQTLRQALWPSHVTTREGGLPPLSPLRGTSAHPFYRGGCLRRVTLRSNRTMFEKRRCAAPTRAGQAAPFKNPNQGAQPTGPTSKCQKETHDRGEDGRRRLRFSKKPMRPP